MSSRFDLIVFDWDGTLMDSAGAIVHSVIAASRDLGIEPPTEEKARYIIGLGLLDALQAAVPDLPRERYREMADRYRHHYLSQDQGLSLFEGAEAMVRTLADQGRQLAVATGKSRQGLNRALQGCALGPLFHATRCADECHSKPHPQMLEEIMAELDVSPERTLMVGDTTHDLQMAANAGVAAVAVSYGAHSETMLREAPLLHCAPSMADLADWLARHA